MAIAGCQTTDTNTLPEPTATVLAPNSSTMALGQAVLEVFVAEGYSPVSNSRSEFVFEKPSGTLSNIAYGGLLDSSVWTRVTVRILPLDDTTHQLTADAYRIRDRGSSLEEKDHLGGTHARGYRALLKKVAKEADE